MDRHKVFDILPEHFFSVLSCPNQSMYIDCLFLMYNYLGKGSSFGGKKNSIVELLKDYFNNQYKEFNSSPQEKAISVLRKFKQCGWIFEEEDGNYEVLVNFTYFSIPILKTLSDLKKNQPLEYLGYLFLIYSALKNIELESLSDILDQIYQNTTILMNRLKSLNANIKKYIQDLLNKKDKNDLKTILDNLFFDYKENIVDRHYQRLKTSDNISKYRPYIISKLNEICLNDKEMNLISMDLVNKKKFQNASLARKHVERQIDFIITSFENFEIIMSEIDKKNTKYIETSISKILFIINNKDDLQGKINYILRYMVKKKLSHENSLFRIFSQKFLETSSLYTMPVKSFGTSLQTIENEKALSIEEKELHLKKILESNVYSKSKINIFVNDLLKYNEKFCASEIPLSNIEDYTKLILIYMYSGGDVNYTIQRLNQMVKKDDYVFYDFEIRRK